MDSVQPSKEKPAMKPIQIHPVSALGCVAVLGAFSMVQKGVSNSGPLNPAPTGETTLTPEQEEILSHVSIVYLDDGQGGLAKTLRFHDVNVQIVNGLGATNGYPTDPTSISPGFTQTNGLGNLIVGYNEPADLFHTGSHNIVVGNYHTYSSFGGLVVGTRNTISGAYSSVTGGLSNTASGLFSSVSGGGENQASGFRCSVSGGVGNVASGRTDSVSGGSNNTAAAVNSTVSGGCNNSTTATCEHIP